MFFNKRKVQKNSPKNNLINKLFSAWQNDDNQVLLDKIEELLIEADLGVKLTHAILENIKTAQKKDKLSKDELRTLLRKELASSLIMCENVIPTDPTCFLIVGVNGVGKTTSIAKIAQYFKATFHKNIYLIAADTFRAGAIEQLNIWGERLGLRVINQQAGSDPAAVVFDGISAAKSKQIPLVISDTAGRLHNKKNLMLELEKIKKAIAKADDSRKITTLMVVDASLGQNVMQQAEIFNESVKIDGFILSKIDSSSKGGIVFQLCQTFQLPIYFLGTGETLNDILLFDTPTFLDKFLEGENL